MRKIRLSAGVWVAAAVGLAAVGIVSIANAADGDEQYTGCLKNGALTNVAVGSEPLAKCPTGATVATWSQQGPQGIQGIQGPQGIQGEQGPAGTVATSEVYFVEDGGSALGPNGPGLPDSGGHQVSMNLPAGSYVIELDATIQNSATNSDGASAVCTMPGGVSLFKFLDDRSGTDWHATQERIEMTTAINHTGGEIEVMDCFSNFVSMSIGDITLLATPVGTVIPG